MSHARRYLDLLQLARRSERALVAWLSLVSLLLTGLIACEVCEDETPIGLEDGEYRFDEASHDPNTDGEATAGLRAAIRPERATLTFPSPADGRLIVIELEREQ